MSCISACFLHPSLYNAFSPNGDFNMNSKNNKTACPYCKVEMKKGTSCEGETVLSCPQCHHSYAINPMDRYQQEQEDILAMF
jgi:hypothetical protein